MLDHDNYQHSWGQITVVAETRGNVWYHNVSWILDTLISSYLILSSFLVLSSLIFVALVVRARCARGSSSRIAILLSLL
jgi:hypothetical protein